MFRDLITLLAFGVLFFVLYVLVLENKDRVERDGHGLPVIGVFLAWLSPILDEVYEATIGRRLRGHNKDKKTSSKSTKRTRPAHSEATKEEDQHVGEDASKVSVTGSHSKRRTSTETAQSTDTTDHSKSGKPRKRKRKSSKRRSTYDATSEEDGKPVGESHDRQKKKKKRRSKRKTQGLTEEKVAKSTDESLNKQKKPGMSPRNSKQKRQTKSQVEPSSDEGPGHSSENSADKKPRVKKEAPVSTRYSRLMKDKYSKEQPTSEEYDSPELPAKNSVDQPTKESPLIALPRKALDKLRDSFKGKKKSKK